MLVTVKVVVSVSLAVCGSVAVQVMVSLPYQSVLGVVMVAMRLLMVIVRSVWPVAVQVMVLSGLSMSVT